jgi:hypothetical protein
MLRLETEESVRIQAFRARCGVFGRLEEVGMRWVPAASQGVLDSQTSPRTGLAIGFDSVRRG